MANFSVDPQGVTGVHIDLQGNVFRVHRVDVGGALLRRIVEQPDVVPPGAQPLVPGFLIWRYNLNHFDPVGFPADDYATLDWTALQDGDDDEVLSCAVLDRGQTQNDPVAVLKTWSQALSGT